MTALGKVIGGGLPVGAYGARHEIMEQLSPLGPVYQAGTLSGNPLAMAAGATTLDLLDEAAYDYMESLGALLEKEMGAVLEKHGNPMRLVRRESLFWLSPGDGEPAIRADQIAKDAAGLYADVHRALLDRGYMLAPSAYEIGFISTTTAAPALLNAVKTSTTIRCRLASSWVAFMTMAYSPLTLYTATGRTTLSATFRTTSR